MTRQLTSHCPGSRPWRALHGKRWWCACQPSPRQRRPRTQWLRAQVFSAVRHLADDVRDAVDGVAQVEDRHQRQPQGGDARPPEQPERAAEEHHDVRDREGEIRTGPADPPIPGIGGDVGGQVDVLLVRTRPVHAVEQDSQRAGERVQNARQGVLAADVPAVVRMPEAVARRMRIVGLVGVRVVEAVVSGPLDRRSRREAQRHEQALEAFRQHRRTMRQHAVIADADRQPGAEVVAGARDRERQRG